MRRALNLAALVCGGVLGLVALFGLYNVVAGGDTDAASPPKHTATRQESRPGHRGYDAATTVKGVLGGDTVRIGPAIDGANVVRLIGVDAPDAEKPGAGGQPYGRRASRFAESVLDGEKVGLEFDVERKDRYGRLLAYVYPMGDSMFNEVLLRKGYAQVYTIQPNDKHRDKFTEEQDKAKEGKLGIWGLSRAERCELANHGNGIGGGSPGCKAKLRSPPKHDSEPEHEHVPAASSGASAGPDLDCPDLTYKQAQAEMAADPSDPFDLDQDGDGVACEGLRGGGVTSATATVSAASTASPNP
jgi:endonuclease YncB( thermonuclease family)